MLHERLTKRELNCRELESKLAEKEELTMELAQKFISANQEKDEICNEYDRILQTTVFSRTDEHGHAHLLEKHDQAHLLEKHDITATSLPETPATSLPDPEQTTEPQPPQLE